MLVKWCDNIFDKKITPIKCKNNTVLTMNKNKRWDFCSFLFCPSLMVSYGYPIFKVEWKANEVALAESKIDLLQGEKQTNLDSQIWAKLDIRFLRNGCWKFLCILLFLPNFSNTLIKLLGKIGKIWSWILLFFVC